MIAGVVENNHAIRGALPLPTVDLRGLRVHALTERECIAHILSEIGRGRGGWVVTPNLDILRRWDLDNGFRSLIADADLVVADGMPLVWASRLQGTPLPERIAGSTLITSLSQAAAEAHRSVFLFGGAPGAAEEAAKMLQRAAPTLRVAGIRCPAMGFENREDEMRDIATHLAAAQPDFVFVALGCPKQELFIKCMRNAVPGAWWLGIGVSFSFLAGHVKRAPRWMQRAGLEWVHRLSQQPRSLARRYLIDGIPFGARLLGSSTRRGIARRLSSRNRFGQLPDSHPNERFMTDEY